MRVDSLTIAELTLFIKQVEKRLQRMENDISYVMDKAQIFEDTKESYKILTTELEKRNGNV